MYKTICAGLLVILCMGLLSGCSKKADVETSTVFIEKKGNIVSVDVEALDRDYYDMDELESYITEHVTEYTDKNGETIEKESFVVADGQAKLMMKYDTCEDYTGFNGIELYNGTVVKARAAGYDFDTEFYSPEDDTQKVGKDTVIAEDDNNVAIIRANVDVQVPGTILYVSVQEGTNAAVTGKNKVSITSGESGEEAGLTYIVYK